MSASNGPYPASSTSNIYTCQTVPAAWACLYASSAAWWVEYFFRLAPEMPLVYEVAISLLQSKMSYIFFDEEMNENTYVSVYMPTLEPTDMT